LSAISSAATDAISAAAGEGESASEAAGESVSSALEATATAASEAAAATGEAVVNAVRAVIREVTGEAASAANEEIAKHATRDALLQMSRGLAVLLLLVYVIFHMPNPSMYVVADVMLSSYLCSRIYLHDPPGDEDNLHQHKDAPQELKEEEMRLATLDPEVNQWVCIVVLIVALALMAVTAEFVRLP
jgi:hypothetical protein